MKTSSLVLVAAFCSACGANVDASAEGQLGSLDESLSNKDFDVDFSGCAEFAGIGWVPTEGARPYVPPNYTLAGDEVQTPVVVRVARCAGAVIDGKAVGPTLTSQVGLTLQGPDASASINNYTVFYATNQARLHARLQAAGVASDKSNDLELSLLGDNLNARSSSAHSSCFQVSGTATASSGAPSIFAASWWADGVHGVVQARTSFPEIRFGGASTMLATTPGSALATLLGGSTFTFAILDSYNTFEASHLEVRNRDD